MNLNPRPIQIYIPAEDKEAFKRACFLCDTTMSRELRRFIRQYANNPPIPKRDYYRLRPLASMEAGGGKSGGGEPPEEQLEMGLNPSKK